MKSLVVNTKQANYPVIIGTNIHNQLSTYLEQAGIDEKRKILVVTDENVAPLYLNKVIHALKNFNISYYIIPPGENSKSNKYADNIIEFAIKQGLDRTSVILALGGGVVGDLAGYVAAIYMRGIVFVQLPTTLLAHDSSVGGKVGINHALGKNLIGAFHHPKLVLYDISFLKTLPKREIYAGFAEIIKHGLIADKEFSGWLFDNASDLIDLNLESIEKAIYKAIYVKTKIVEEDEKELGKRALLNYGHTLAHALEIASDFKYLHGEAVAIGMVYASWMAYKLNLIEYSVVSFTTDIIDKYQLPTTLTDEYDTEELVNIMKTDKKFINGDIRMILPTEIGQVIIKNGIDYNLAKSTLEEIIFNKGRRK